MKLIRFILLSLTVLFGGLYLLYVSYVYFNQQEMVFIHYKLDKNYSFDFDGDFTEINTPVEANTNIHGLLFKANAPKGLVFYLHGNAGALDTWGKIANQYTNLGYDFFIMDYRGFGKSDGAVENSKQVLNDASLVYEKISKGYENVIVIGYSIGTGPATFLASKYHPNQLILQAPYFNFLELTREKAPFFPDFLKKFDFATNQYIGKTKSQITIFHGVDDQMIAAANSEKLQQYLKKSDKLFLLEDQGHLGMNDNIKYQEELKKLIDNH
ncbi:lysophospholipase [Flavobacterium amniphilum]|uniref:alpha/beta hydrolase n=1 Tax=Flavobacterium amniphilum TaxID=1834035 RepID=UPI00202A0BF4|nr:alpha/beta fold hydrolase [Flavobacterium amniphilum]MCL9804992.1 lysophospholipase [Flavobacterium amniphilum]